MDLTKEPVNRLIITLAVPAGTAMMFNTLYNVTGTFFCRDDLHVRSRRAVDELFALS